MKLVFLPAVYIYTIYEFIWLCLFRVAVELLFGEFARHHSERAHAKKPQGVHPRTRSKGEYKAIKLVFLPAVYIYTYYEFVWLCLFRVAVELLFG